MRILQWVAALAVGFVFSSTLVRADDGNGGKGNAGADLSLFRVADINGPGVGSGAFPQSGTDPLKDGLVTVGGNGKVGVALSGASPSQAYSVYFCRFGFGQAGCLLLGQAGALATDAKGNGSASVTFPPPAPNAPNNWAGAFVLTRSGTTTNEYVSGFRLNAASTQQPGFEFDGLISSITAGKLSFRIGNLGQDIFTNGSTQYGGGLKGFADLIVGMRVEVQGTVMVDGTLLANSVDQNGTDDDPPRWRGHRKGP